MKRSEMYKLMVNTMLNELKDYDKINSLDIAIHMDEVLKVMEQSGIIPPPKKLHLLKLNKDGDISIQAEYDNVAEVKPIGKFQGWEKE